MKVSEFSDTNINTVLDKCYELYNNLGEQLTEKELELTKELLLNGSYDSMLDELDILFNKMWEKVKNNTTLSELSYKKIWIDGFVNGVAFIDLKMKEIEDESRTKSK